MNINLLLRILYFFLQRILIFPNFLYFFYHYPECVRFFLSPAPAVGYNPAGQIRNRKKTYSTILFLFSSKIGGKGVQLSPSKIQEPVQNFVCLSVIFLSVIFLSVCLSVTHFGCFVVVVECIYQQVKSILYIFLKSFCLLY